MAGMRITTNLSTEDARRAVVDAATDMGFTCTEDPEGGWRAIKGNFALSLIAGALIAYCNFRINCTAAGSGATIFIERNKPWWTGLIGINRVAKQARLLAEKTRDYIQDMNQTATVEEVK